MAITVWSPGTLYLPGSLVVPSSSGPSVATGLVNPGFESGDTGWTKDAGWAINATKAFSGTQSAEYSATGNAAIVNSTKHAISPGITVNVSCMAETGGSISGNAIVSLSWYNAASALILTSFGSIAKGSAGVWTKSSLAVASPPTTAFVSVGAAANASATPVYVDNFQWDYLTTSTVNTLVYTAVQAAAGLSGLAEPTWPLIAGQQVTDNAVTWEASTSGTVTWEASSVLTSGSSEPTWPEEAGAFVSDNNIAWECVPLRITDPDCPHTKVVAIAASKVFAGDSDIVRFCATLNARDWSSQADAGFIPTGLQQKSQVGVNAMGVYRGNLAVWSASTFQVWQVDPDPAAMALLDAMEGIGSIHQQAVQPVSDELFFLSALGVRTVSIGGGSNNLAAGDAGVPIDILVQAEVTNDVEPLASYFPGAGQYWLAFRTLTLPILAVGAYLLTSTLYPVEVIDGLDFSINLTSGHMLKTFDEPATNTMSLVSGKLLPTLLTAPIQEEAAINSMELVYGDLYTTLTTAPTVDEAGTNSMELISGDLKNNLIFALTPDEGLDFVIVLTSGSMTAA